MGMSEGIERPRHSDIAGRAGAGWQSTQGFPLVAYIPSSLDVFIEKLTVQL